MINKFLLGLLMSLFVTVGFGQTTTVTQNANFESDSNSMWGLSGNPTIEDEISLFHVPWNQSINTGSGGIVTIVGQSFGGAFQGAISGQIGSKIGYNFTSGAINVQYPIDVNIEHPTDLTYDQGDIVTIGTDYVVLDSNKLETIYPGGEVKWDLYFQLAASASATICVFGCTTFPIIPSFDTGLISINLVTISSNGATTGPGGTQGPSGIWYLGPGSPPPYITGSNTDPSYPGTQPTVDGSLFPYAVDPVFPDGSGSLGDLFIDWIPWQVYVPLSIDLPDNDFGLSGQLTLPYVFTEDSLFSDNHMEACGDSTYFEISLEIFDLLGYILQQVPEPITQTVGQVLSNLAGSYDPLAPTPFAGLAIVQWNFFSASLVLDITNNQCFNFDPKIYGSFQFPFPVEYQVFNSGAWGAQSTGSIVNIELGDSIRYKFPCYFSDVTFIPTYTIVGQMSNRTWDEIGIRFDMSALGFGLQLSAFTIIPGFTIPSVCFPLPYPCPSWSCPWCWCTTTVCTPEIVVPPIGFGGYAVWITTSGVSTGSAIPDPLPTMWSYSLPIATIPYDWFNETWTLPGFTPIIGDTIRMRSRPLGINHLLANVDCFGGNNGSITVTTSAVTPASPFVYSLWSSSGTATTSVVGVSNTYSNLVEGSYQISVIDNNGCQMYTGGVITQPAPISIAGIENDKSCFSAVNDGSIALTVTGGTSGYNISWTGPSSGNPAGTEISADGGSYAINNIGEGIYSISLTDANNCISNSSYTIDVPELLGQNGIVGDVNCFGDTTGFIDVTTFGGTLPYTFSWSSTDTTEDLINLGFGAYTLNIVDGKNCTSQSTYNVAQPAAPLQLTISGTDVNCYAGTDGTIDLTITGGTPGYSIGWSNDQNIILPMTTEDLANVTAGVYTAEIEDSKGCSALISQTIIQPVAPLATPPVITAVNCFGDATGSIDPVITGGTAPYVYNWSNGSTSSSISGVIAGTYTLTVVDSKNCNDVYTYEIVQPSTPLVVSLNGTDILCKGDATGSIVSNVSGGSPAYQYLWNTGSTLASINGLIAGNYSLTVTDAKGCTSTASQILNEPAQPLVATSIPTNVNCFGGNNGAIDLTITGGTLPYSYVWTNAQSLILTTSTQDLVDITANSYSVNVLDQNGCQIGLTQVISQPAASLTITDIIDHVNCFGNNDGSIDITVSGGTAPYTYNWSNATSNEDLAGLIAGTYTVTVTDAQGCMLSSQYSVLQPNAQLSVTTSTTPVKCKTGTDGTVTSYVSGGTAPYIYSWSNGAITPGLNLVSAGIYSLTVTDNQGCTTFTGAVVEEPANTLSVSISVTDPSCFGYDDGEIDITVAGGTQPYSFNWGNQNEILMNNPSETLDSVSVGNYLFRISDENGCIIEQMITVNEPTILSVNHIVTDALCFGDSTGIIDLTISGATPPYSISWSNGMTTEDALQIPAGTYNYFVTDAQGCVFRDLATVAQPSAVNIDYSVVGVSCLDQTDGQIDLNAFGGTAPYVYSWSTGLNTPSISDLAPGTYSLIVSDDNLCVSNYSFVIDLSGIECVGIPNTISPNGDNYNDTWHLENIDLYPNAKVKVFNRWGNLLYSTDGEYKEWDGTVNGQPLPSEVYYYIITLGNPDDNQYTGTITIVR